MGEGIVLASHILMLQFLKGKKSRPSKGHMVVTLEGAFNRDTGHNWYMFSLEYVTWLGLEVSKWVVRRFIMLAEEEGR